jgi:hypothetical protein
MRFGVHGEHWPPMTRRLHREAVHDADARSGDPQLAHLHDDIFTITAPDRLIDVDII